MHTCADAKTMHQMRVQNTQNVQTNKGKTTMSKEHTNAYKYIPMCVCYKVSPKMQNNIKQ